MSKDNETINELHQIFESLTNELSALDKNNKTLLKAFDYIEETVYEADEYGENEHFKTEPLSQQLGKRNQALQLLSIYIDSYFDASIEIRNKMLVSKKKSLFFSCNFLVIHLIELIIKHVTIYAESDVTKRGLKKQKAMGHNIRNLFNNQLSVIKSFGVKDKEIDCFLDGLKYFEEKIKNGNVSTALRYPIGESNEIELIKNDMFIFESLNLEEYIIVNKKIIYAIMIIYFRLMIANNNEINTILNDKIKELEKEYKINVINRSNEGNYDK